MTTTRLRLRAQIHRLNAQAYRLEAQLFWLAGEDEHAEKYEGFARSADANAKAYEDLAGKEA